MILAPAIMTSEKDQKVAAFKCFESCGLDPDLYRIGHTKARIFLFQNLFLILFEPPFPYSTICLNTFNFTVHSYVNDK